MHQNSSVLRVFAPIHPHSKGLKMYPQSAKQALAQLQSIPTIHQDYSSFRFSRLFHYDHLELEGFSISEGCWVTLWSIHNLEVAA